jgi:hypothetical protein
MAGFTLRTLTAEGRAFRAAVKAAARNIKGRRDNIDNLEGDTERVPGYIFVRNDNPQPRLRVAEGATWCYEVRVRLASSRRGRTRAALYFNDADRLQCIEWYF